MIAHPALLLTVLILVVSAVVTLARKPSAQFFFKYLPIPLWCYFIPTVLSTMGIIPSSSPLYSMMSHHLLPACLILLLIGTNLPSILKLSPKALAAMVAGTLGIFVGGMVTIPFLVGTDPDLWKGWGTLAASWNGGSANMIAVKEILDTPESLFSKLIIVDTVIAYSWMAFLVFASRFQGQIDRFLGAVPFQTETAGSASRQASDGDSQESLPKKYLMIASLVILSLLAGFLFWIAAGWLPTYGTFLKRMTWTIILATALPLALSMTPARKIEEIGASRTGNFLLFLLLTSIGARANLSALITAPSYIVMGFLWVIVHGAFLLGFGRLFKVPCALLASASQANLGGAVSAPIVASVYNRNLAPVALVLAVFGGIYGTYSGLLFSKICRILTTFL